MEKFESLYNESGQIKDPEIAEKIAYDEKELRGHEDPKTARFLAEAGEAIYHAEKMSPVIVEKIKSILSEEELAFLKERLNSSDEEKFKNLLFN